MRYALIALLFVFTIVPSDRGYTQAQPFEHDGIANDAKAYETYLTSNWRTDGKNHDQWVDAGKDALTRNLPRQASGAFAAAVVLDRNDALSWLSLARSFLAMNPKNHRERYSFPQNASSAAYIAYKRSDNSSLKAASLAILAQALTKRSLWRPALEAYKNSLSLSDSANVRAEYVALNAQHGFRMLDYSVDSDAASPRICVQFSEPLAKGRFDYAPYISIDGRDPQSLVKEDRQLCVEDLKHGQRYQISVRAGLPAEIKETLTKTVQLTAYVRDRKPSVRFTGKNYVLPRSGQNGIPIISVNSDELQVTIFHIGDRNLINAVVDGNFQRQISSFDANRLKDSQGSQIWTGAMPVKNVLNQEVTTAFPIDQVISEMKPGLYVMQASSKNSTDEPWQAKATQWFVVSDIGLTAFSNENGVYAFTRALASAEPVSDVEVRLLARNNEILGKAKSDENGHVKFARGLMRGQGGSAPALLIATKDQGDFAFLDLTRSSFDLTDRGVDGRLPSGPMDAYLFTERGVYRPGESVFLTALLRNSDGISAANIPLILKIVRPDGVQHTQISLPDQGYGGRTYQLDLQSIAMAGTWRVSAYVDPKDKSVGSTSFLVEDFVPERLELDVASGAGSLSQSQDAMISVYGKYLYGAPASGLTLEGEISVEPAKHRNEGLKGYHFGLEDEKFTPLRRPLADLPVTDKEGKASIPIHLPPINRSFEPLAAKVVIRLREPSGRAVEENLEIPVATEHNMIGIKPHFRNRSLGEGENAEFSILSVDGKGQSVSLGNIKWQLSKVHRRYQWYNHNGAWNFEPVSYSQSVANGIISLSDEKPTKLTTPVEWGRYRLDIASIDANGPAASYTFSAGWYGDDSHDTPDVLDIALDRDKYKPGDKINITLSTKTSGKAMVAIVGDTLLDFKSVDVSGEGGKIQFEAKKSWGPGAYVTAMFYRPLDQKSRRMPGRSIGIRWLELDQSGQTLNVRLNAEKKVRPDQSLSVPVTVRGLKPGSQAKIVVSAVDVGILNITNHASPDPNQWYFGQRRLAMEVRDIYGALIDGMQGVIGRIRSGGDGPAPGLEGKAPKQEPLAMFSGIIDVDQSGLAEVEFDLPDFDGTLKLSAVAWNDSQLGHAETEITVRDPVIVSGTLPRFLTSGDKSSLHLSVHNVEGPEGNYELSIAGDGPVSFIADNPTRTLGLKSGQRQEYRLPIEANGTGTANLTVTLDGPNDIKISRSYNIPVQPVSPGINRRFVSTIQKDGGRLTVDRAIVADLIAETVKVTMSVGRSATLDIPGLMMALDQYPYGCAEQTTSKALPLLYLSSVARGAGIEEPSDIRKRVNKAISRLESMQNSSGGFGLWGPEGEDLWLTAYVADFLTRARALNYSVKTSTLDNALDRLKNHLNFAPDFKTGGEDLAYALYVLARNSRASIGDLRYYSDTRLDRFSSPLAQAHLGAALSFYGDKNRSRTAFTAAISRLDSAGVKTVPYRTDFGSHLRDSAATLTLISETGIASDKAPELNDLLEQLGSSGRLNNTQENAWLLLAAYAIQKQERTLSFELNGVSHKASYRKILDAGEFANNPVVVRNQSEFPLKVVFSVNGASNSPEPPVTNGFKIQRTVYTLDGQQVELDRVSQNERFVIVLQVEETDARSGRLLLVDRLPAGFEIENPRLVDSAKVNRLSWLSANSNATHTEFRDDRFVAAFDTTRRQYNGQNNRNSERAFTVAYMVRAVSPGRYVYPSASIEDMYRSERFARTETGVTEIVSATQQ